VAGFVSVRLSKEERRKLLALKTERGCKSISQVVRLMLGFPRGTDEGLEGADDIESIDQMCQLVVRMVDRMDEEHKLLIKVARQVGVPMERKTIDELRAVAGRQGPWSGPERPVAIVETGPIDLNVPVPTRNGDRHPDMPDGFSRG
jgi:hypothetical protein